MGKEERSILVLAIITAFVAPSLFAPGLIIAGDLDTSNPPGSTMHTLDEIYHVITDPDGCPDCPPSIVVDKGAPKTGQTKSYEPGDDGDLEKGVAWPNPRFTDEGDGTVTDNMTGLMWLKDANCIVSHYSGFDADGRVTWQYALDYVTGINNGTYSDCGAGYIDWRLPNIKELLSLIHWGVYSPALPNTAGTGRWTDGNPFSGVPVGYDSYYWSATTYAYGTGTSAWTVYLPGGYGMQRNKTSYYNYVWPVRGGQ